MPKISKILAGKKAKARGDIFENAFRAAAYRAYFKPIQIPMGAKFVGKDRMIRVRTPFDFVLIHRKGTVFLDTKISLKKTFSYTQCTPHQVAELMEIERLGHLAGYVVYFSELNRIVFFHSHKLTRLQLGMSLRPEDGEDLGSLQTLNLINVLEKWIEQDRKAPPLKTKVLGSQPETQKIPSGTPEDPAK